MKLLERRQGNRAETEEQVEFQTSFDVIVVGLGTAGAIAAIRAAGHGLRVLAIERLNGMGGTGTLGGVVNYYYGTRGGICEDIDKQAADLQRQDDFLTFRGVHAELKSWILEREAVHRGVTIRYESYVIGVYKSGSTIKGVRWVSPEGIHATGAGIIIDCTGNADVCELAGCGLHKGRNLDGRAQPFSNVQMKMVDRTFVRNMYIDSGYVDIEDPRELNRAIMDSNSSGIHLPDRFSEESLLLKTSQLLGIRESRNIVGEITITLEDVLADRVTKEPAFLAYSNLDNHAKDIALESDIQQQWSTAASLWGLNFPVPIPAGALIPQGMDGLLVAGRCLAVDHDLAGCVRQKRDMQKSGETAANLAFLAITRKLSVRKVPYSDLLPLQLATGCLDLGQAPAKRDVSPQDYNDRILTPGIHWLEDPVEIRAGLDSDKPGIAIWSAKREGAGLISHLLQWSSNRENERLRKHSAVALGLLGHKGGASVLREIVAERDWHTPRTSRKYNQPLLFGAIYLLGRLEDRESLPQLLSLLGDDSLADRLVPPADNKEFIFDREEQYAQLISYCTMSALRIAEAASEWREAVRNAVAARLSSSPKTFSLTLKSHHPEWLGLTRQDIKPDLLRVAMRRFEQWETAGG